MWQAGTSGEVLMALAAASAVIYSAVACRLHSSFCRHKTSMRMRVCEIEGGTCVCLPAPVAHGLTSPLSPANTLIALSE